MAQFQQRGSPGGSRPDSEESGSNACVGSSPTGSSASSARSLVVSHCCLMITVLDMLDTIRRMFILEFK